MHCSFFALRLGISLLALPLLPGAAQADWLQYRGPSQNGMSPEKGFNTPKPLWKAEVGKGVSAITTMEGRAYTMGNNGSADQIFCFEANTGKVVWQQQFPAPLDPKMFEGGTRSTPSLDGSRVYVVSHEGELRCLGAATGKPLWNVNYQRDFGGRRPDWGFAGSPLLTGSLVICDVGGPAASTVAFDKLTGKVVWKSGTDAPGYATPVLASLGGVPTLIILKAEALVGYEPKTGKELWRSTWKTMYDINAATPLVLEGDKIFITSGYNAGCALLQVKGGHITELWHNKNLRAHINSPVATGGAIYGLDGNTGGGNLTCLDVATGERRWTEKSVKGGSLVLAENRLIVFTEKGELVVCAASPSGFQLFSRSQQLDHRCWTQPTLDAGHLFLRNNDGDLVCLEVAGK